jgi:hypothetical protein
MGDSIPKLEQLSKLFVREPFPIVVSGRRFIREGHALKQCRKSWSERELLLFSDVFIYAQSKSGKFIIPTSYSCAFLRSVPRTYSGKSCIDIHTPRKSFVLQFSSQADRDVWIVAFQEAIVNARAQRPVPQYKEAPIWVPDPLVSECQRCKAALTFFRRKHHCRECGNIFCNSCLSKRIKMEHISTKLCKICLTCWEANQREENKEHRVEEEGGGGGGDEDYERVEAEIPRALAQGSSSDTSMESDSSPEPVH